MQFVFNRAFDVSADLMHSLQTLILCGCSALLTSAGAATAFQGKSTLSQLVHAAAGRISIIAAAGINATCAADVVAASASASTNSSIAYTTENSADTVWIHMSGNAVVPTGADPELKYRTPSLNCLRGLCFSG